MIVSIQKTKVTPENCPLCGETNNCANLSPSDSKQECWCASTGIEFPESLLNKVPSADKNKSCICQACLLKHSQ